MRLTTRGVVVVVVIVVIIVFFDSPTRVSKHIRSGPSTWPLASPGTPSQSIGILTSSSSSSRRSGSGGDGLAIRVRESAGNLFDFTCNPFGGAACTLRVRGRAEAQALHSPGEPARGSDAARSHGQHLGSRGDVYCESTLLNITISTVALITEISQGGHIGVIERGERLTYYWCHSLSGPRLGRHPTLRYSLEIEEWMWPSSFLPLPSGHSPHVALAIDTILFVELSKKHPGITWERLIYKSVVPEKLIWK
eukprot:jgi/Bigna1/71507/fgenesh1_pg.16_\